MIPETKSAAILWLLQTPGIGPARVRSILERAAAEAWEISSIQRDSSLQQRVLSDTQQAAFDELAPQMEKDWEEIRSQGLVPVAIGDQDYPAALSHRLGRKAPPLLLTRGNIAIGSARSVGFCGSRKASDKGIATAQDCADQLARNGVNIVSGYAAGVDMTTHRAALAAGGTTTIVLAEGIFHFQLKHDLRDVWNEDRVLVVSEFVPGVPWSVHNAMQRNTTICGLSGAMVLIEAGETGGSIEAGRTSLKLEIPLFAPVYQGMPATAVGNRQLLKQGARALMKGRSTGRANMRPVLNALDEQKRPSGTLWG